MIFIKNIYTFTSFNLFINAGFDPFEREAEIVMSDIQNVVIAGSARTAIGDFGGAFKDTSPVELARCVIKSAIERSNLEASDIGHVVLGNVIHTEPRDMYISRVASIEAGIADSTPALTVNRLCGSGLQAIISATQLLMLGDVQIAVAGGSECMSRAGYLMPSARWGKRMGDAEVIDMMTMALHDPFGHGHMGITAENVAKQFKITREEQDVFALESHKRAAQAIKNGYFDNEIVSVSLNKKKNKTEFKTDEHVRYELSIDDLQKLKPAFAKGGAVTAGNASGLNDGAGALVLMNEKEAYRKELDTVVRVVSYGFSGVAPEIMGMGPVQAVKQALKRAQLRVEDLDVIESNEAFASQACAVSNELGFDAAVVNPNGGAIALGHPIGASGAIITIKLIHELKRIKGRFGLATMCIGGGQGIALIVEAL